MEIVPAMGHRNLAPPYSRISRTARRQPVGLGIELSGDKTAISKGVTIELTDANGSTEGVDQDPETTTAKGVSISMNFGSLFN